MNTFLQILLAAAAVVVVAEGLNKLDRVDPLEKGLSQSDRISAWLKGLAWFLLSLGAGVYLFALVFSADPTGDLARMAAPLVLIGFAVLIVRTRVKEG
jgi:hypothetical protein